jgi:hypothetical protein
MSATLACVAAIAWAAPASATELLRDGVTAQHAVNSSCSANLRAGPGVVRRHLIAPATGELTARLHGGAGDWDLAVFGRSRREPVAASAYRGSREVAGGFVSIGDVLTVQACRRSGRGSAVRLAVDLDPIVPGEPETESLVDVTTPTQASKQALTGLGLDVTERAGPRFVEVLLHGADDAAKLRAAGFAYTVRVPDLAAQDRRNAAADERYAASVNASALPTGRTTYRVLADYGNEMKALANANPDLVKPITLKHTSWLGRPVEGLEITTNPNARDGKPVFLLLGMHHAREWPSGEIALEWAYELIQDYRANNTRVRSLLANTRTIIVPLVNPDGFNFSRAAGHTNGHDGGDSGFDSSNAEYHRKTCHPDPNPGCVVSRGVDPNRNYGYLWGETVGGSASPTNESYFGPAPFSEPEAQNVRELISSRQVVTMITLHTFADEILRQPGLASQGPTPDEAVYKKLGDEMAAENGYSNIFSYQLYDHAGTTDMWSYYTTGGLGYVVEMGPSYFHPPYAQMVAQYDGSSTPGDGNREALFKAMESTANSARHAVLSGIAPPGAILRLTKDVSTPTSTGPDIPDHLTSSLQVPPGGGFTWHVNSSGRPLVPSEQWTLRCERPEGTVRSTQKVSIARGQSKQVGVPGCFPLQPGPGPVTGKAKVKLRLKLRATFNGRFYRAHVTGGLRKISDDRLCAGSVRITLKAKRHRIRSRKTAVDAGCGFERSFKFRRRALPKSLRKRGARMKLQTVAHWNGNRFLLPAERRVSRRVKRR